MGTIVPLTSGTTEPCLEMTTEAASGIVSLASQIRDRPFPQPNVHCQDLDLDLDLMLVYWIYLLCIAHCPPQYAWGDFGAPCVIRSGSDVCLFLEEKHQVTHATTTWVVDIGCPTCLRFCRSLAL